ncbi:hypothetical protein FOA52_013350 [Chlamydomonas sp. UWO 241]|nr:hypothetical protein FOA52_013350 [Chlamydomonas sp. UWO 241]
MEQTAVVHNSFKAPEGGKYTLQCERTYGTLPFSYTRATRLVYASLRVGGDHDGDWLLYNAGDYVYVTKHDSIKREPTRALNFASSSISKPAHPTCLAWTPCKDGADTLVGTFDGSVELLSLKALFKQAPTSTKPVVAGKVTPEPENDECRITAVAWQPRSPDGTFVASTSSGCVYVYKRGAVAGDAPTKFLGLGSSSKPAVPAAVWSPGGGCVYDVAFSPDGRTLAVACRDGGLRLLDASSGAVVGGMSSYYGAFLCCAFSGDGKYVAAGSEDDLVSVYGVAERGPVAHCEGHRSWVSAVRFDPWVPSDVAPAGAPPDAAGIYRLVSVGQDASLFLWEIQCEAAVAAAALSPSGGAGAQPTVLAASMRKSTSAASLAVGGWQGGPAEAASATLARRPSIAGGVLGALAPPPTRGEMPLYEPLNDHRLHADPISDLLLTERMVYTADHGGCVRLWARPDRAQACCARRA